MRPIVTDRVAWSVCRSVTFVSPAKTAEVIEMPFGLWTRLGLRNHVFDGVQIPLRRVNFEGQGSAHCKVYGLSAVSCAKTAEPIEVPFEMCTPVQRIACIRWGCTLYETLFHQTHDNSNEVLN